MFIRKISRNSCAAQIHFLDLWIWQPPQMEPYMLWTCTMESFRKVNGHKKALICRTKIEQYQLDKVVGLGRIWRITHEGNERDKTTAQNV